MGVNDEQDNGKHNKSYDCPPLNQSEAIHLVPRFSRGRLVVGLRNVVGQS